MGLTKLIEQLFIKLSRYIYVSKNIIRGDIVMRRETQSRKKHKSAYKKIGVLFCAFLLLIMNMYPTWACDFVVSNYSSADIESVENSGTETDEEASPGVSESEDEAVDTETPPDVSESEDEGELPDSSDVEENTGADEDVSEPDEGETVRKLK